MLTYPRDTQSVEVLPASAQIAVDNGLLATFDESYEAVSKGKATDEQVKILWLL